MSKGIYINDSIHGLIRLSEYEKQIISSIGFNRLHDVYQNSTVYLTYPSNRTKRFEHSIGTMKLCSDMFYYSIENATEENIKKFYQLYKDELGAVLDNIKENISKYDFLPKTPRKLPSIGKDSFCYSLIPRNISKDYEDIHFILIESIRVAALLHDIGHPPFSHVVERAMKAVYYRSKKETQKTWVQYREKMNEYFGDENRALHEVMGDEISSSILKGIIHSNHNENNGDDCLFRIFILECVQRIFRENTEAFGDLHRLIDGSLDGDRLDYVTRDPANSGLKNGSIDYSRIILDMQMIMSNDNRVIFCVPVKAVNAVEDFLKRRFDLYKTIVFHHRVIKTDYLLEHSVKNLIISYMEKHKGSRAKDENYIPFDISGLWYPLGAATIEEKGNELSQWNDSWLTTVLKKIYFTEYYDNTQQTSQEYIIERQLAELLQHKKHYYSLIKRNEDFNLIDENVRQIFASERNVIEKRVTSLIHLSDEYMKTLGGFKNQPLNAVVDIKGTLDVISEILIKFASEKESYILPYLITRRKMIGLNDFEEKVKEIVQNKCKEFYPNTLDTITVFKTISVGIDKHAILFYDPQQRIYALDEISAVARNLRRENDFRPSFYIYMLINEPIRFQDKRKKDFLAAIGKEIGGLVIDTLKTLIDDFEKQLTYAKKGRRNHYV